MQQCGGRFPAGSWYAAFKVSSLSFQMRLQELLDAVQQCGGRFLLTADHGNAEDMVQVSDLLAIS